jgi:hypothetical protein
MPDEHSVEQIADIATRSDSPTPSSNYGDDDIYNEDFLNELASLESKILAGNNDAGAW